VPNGGWLDGSLNELAGLEVLRRIASDFHGHPPVTVRLVDWADEEGARFGRSLLGSSAFAGTHSIEADRSRTDRDGVKLEAALNRCGVQIERFPEAQKEQKSAAAYLELHIEQGPVLERMGLPLGAVLGTKGVERHIITFHGQEAHSGSTPMNARRDALAAAAKLALEIRAIAKKHDDAVCTVGSATWTAMCWLRCIIKLKKQATASLWKKIARSTGRASGTSNPYHSTLSYWICASKPFGKRRAVLIACLLDRCTTLRKSRARESPRL
jgi:hydantoinase/carbamoylase family amidase